MKSTKLFEILWQENNIINVDHLEVPPGAGKKKGECAILHAVTAKYNFIVFIKMIECIYIKTLQPKQDISKVHAVLGYQLGKPCLISLKV